MEKKEEENNNKDRQEILTINNKKERNDQDIGEDFANTEENRKVNDERAANKTEETTKKGNTDTSSKIQGSNSTKEE